MTTTWVVAIDFGTAFSGYCFCAREKPSDVRNPYWGEEETYKSLKTPNCILFDEDGAFKEFGYDALMTYKRMGQNKKHFFNNFKMHLYKKVISRNMMIPDSGGDLMEAMKVFSESIRYLKKHALNMLSEHTYGKTFSASDVTWVLTVPAIWNPAAKQFMREAAIEGGLVTEINSSKLIIALEPEAASVWCKQLPSDGFISEGLDHEILDQKPGTQYIVVDCGGGTVDMTVHQVLEEGRLKELHRASGSDMGGGSVDAKFKTFIRDAFGHDLWDKYEKEHPSEVQRMMFHFVLFKCAKQMRDVYIPSQRHWPDNIDSIFKDVQGASWTGDSIKLSFSKLKELFRESVDKIVQDIRAILDTPKLCISYILLVGGYASSKILQNEVKDQFGGECRILCPLDAQLAVAKGAVLFGVNPMIVASRVSALTYGIAVAHRFDKKIHREENKRVNNAGDYVYCDDLFHKFVENGQSVDCDHIVEYMFGPVNSDQTAMTFQFYSTEAMYVDTKLEAIYVDEPGMKKIGQFTVNMPDIKKGRNRQVKFEISFGLTEIQATATDQASKERESVRLDFMTQ